MLLSAPLLLPALLGLLLSTTVLATPAPQRQQQQQGQWRRGHYSNIRHDGGAEAIAARTDDFSLAMSVNGTYLALVAVSNSTADLVLQAQVVGDSPGTPAYINTTSNATGAYNTSLVLDLTDATAADAAGTKPGAYGLSVPDLGELYGFSENVLAVKDYQEFKFDINEGTVFHQLTSASQSWFACQDVVVGGEPGYFLRWGVFTGQSAAPEGCIITSVVQDFNVATGVRAKRA